MKNEDLYHIFSADLLGDLANRFLKQEMHEEALAVLKNACRLYPENLTLKIQLGRTREAQRVSGKNEKLSPQAEKIREKRDCKANLFYGLGTLYQRRNEAPKATRSFLNALQWNPSNFLTYFSLGNLYYHKREYENAVKFLTRSKALNPFHIDTCYFLSLSLFYLERYEDALLAMIDALILSGDLEKQQPSNYQKQIQMMLEKVDGLSREKRNHLIKARQRKFKIFFERIEQDIAENDFPSVDILPEPIDLTEPIRPPELERGLLARLKKFFLFKNLDEDLMKRISSFSKQVVVKKGEFVYKEKARVEGLFLLEEGQVEIIKESPYGIVRLLSILPGYFFGEEAILFDQQCETSAMVVSEQATALKVDRSALLALFEDEWEVALHFYWYFWKSLALQIRQANEQLKSFFAPAAPPLPTKKDMGDSQKDRRMTNFHLAVNKKEDVFRNHGIPATELRELAKMSNEELFNKGEFIFREGDSGDKLYIIAEGQVLICKKIQGVGEEALAVLSKGDFFGEMALVDGEPRSADAKAQKEGTTVLAVKRDALKKILDMDSGSACRFLAVLYRILSQRLKEIREKIYQWKIMAGGF